MNVARKVLVEYTIVSKVETNRVEGFVTYFMVLVDKSTLNKIKQKKNTFQAIRVTVPTTYRVSQNKEKKIIVYFTSVIIAKIEKKE